MRKKGAALAVLLAAALRQSAEREMESDILQSARCTSGECSASDPNGTLYPSTFPLQDMCVARGPFVEKEMRDALDFICSDVTRVINILKLDASAMTNAKVLRIMPQLLEQRADCMRSSHDDSEFFVCLYSACRGHTDGHSPSAVFKSNQDMSALRLFGTLLDLHKAIANFLHCRHTEMPACASLDDVVIVQPSERSVLRAVNTTHTQPGLLLLAPFSFDALPPCGVSATLYRHGLTLAGGEAVPLDVEGLHVATLPALEVTLQCSDTSARSAHECTQHAHSLEVTLQCRSDDGGVASRSLVRSITVNPQLDVKPHSVLGVHLSPHDAAYAIVDSGDVIGVLELERLFKKRYYGLRPRTSRMGTRTVGGDLGAISFELQQGIAVLHAMTANTYRDSQFQSVVRTDCEYECVHREGSDVGVGVCGTASSPCGFGHLVLAQAVVSQQWQHVAHHKAHASLAMWDSGFERPLILSYDGGGNDGSMMFFTGGKKPFELNAVDYIWNSSSTKMTEKQRRKSSSSVWSPMELGLGRAYAMLAAGLPVLNRATTDGGRFLLPDWDTFLSLPGKLMALGGMAPRADPDDPQSVAHWAQFGIDLHTAFDQLHWHFFAALHFYFDVPYLHELAAMHEIPGVTVKAVGLDVNATIGALSVELEAAMWAALVQMAFERLVSGYLQFVLNTLTETLHFKFDGIVITGGCGLNVAANNRFRRDAARVGLEVFVPSAPGDNGLPVGAAWLLIQPSARPGRHLAYGGGGIFDATELPGIAAAQGATVMVDSAREIAQLFVGDTIVAVVHGRTEVGPRALGHRSLLAFPAHIEVKDKLNTIKSRASYRPVAPIVDYEWSKHSGIVADGSHVESPYMSFAPLLSEQFQLDFPAVVHLDGTGRLQTVRRDESEWLYSLLYHLTALRGAPVLANTSFNRRGQPITNHASVAVAVFQSQPLIDTLVVEDWLFRRPSLTVDAT